MAPPDGSPPHRDVVDTLCKLAGVPSLDVYLGISPQAAVRERLIALERKRREHEALLRGSADASGADPARGPALRSPQRLREADLFLESFDALRAAITPSLSAPLPPDVPDYYAVLGIEPTAAFGAVEAAWKAASARGRDADPRVAQAWRTLGDPLARAHYDRSRRERASHAALRDARTPAPSSNRPEDSGARGAAAGRTVPPSVELVGPSSFDLTVDPDGTETVIVTLVVTAGAGSRADRWTASITSDHPAVSTRPELALSLATGQHTIAVVIDGTRLRGLGTVAATVTLANAREQHALTFRLRQRQRPLRLFGRHRSEAFLLGAAAVALVGVGVWFGSRAAVVSRTDVVVTDGALAQVPSVLACFTPERAPLPSWVEVHTDPFGRVTGVAFGDGGTTAASPASMALDACVRSALVQLTFPTSPDARAVVHRYHLTPPQGPR